MKIRIVFILLGFMGLAAGCTVSNSFTDVVEPELPETWNVTIGEETGCPNITGVFVLTPEVATLQQSGSWSVSKGNWYDHVLLFPSVRGSGQNQIISNESEKYFSDSFAIDSARQDSTIQIISPVKNADDFVVHILEKSEGDYECIDGSFVFPEFRIKGGTEGSVFDGVVFRNATITLSSDLVVYELTQGRKASHKYFLFRNVINAPSTQ